MKIVKRKWNSKDALTASLEALIGLVRAGHVGSPALPSPENADEVFLAVDFDAVAGIMAVQVYHTSIYIPLVSVSPPYRRFGIFRKLHNKAVQIAIKRRKPRVEYFVHRDNTGMLAACERLGGVQTGKSGRFFIITMAVEKKA